MWTELVLAVLVLAALCVPALDVLRGSVRGTRDTVDLARAVQLARSCVDAAEALEFDELDAPALARLVAGIPVPDGVAQPRIDPIRVVRENRSGGVVEAKLVTVRVPWPRGEVVLPGVVLRAR